MYDIPCIIFAGGKSSRMGEDKSLLPFAAFSTLAEYQHSRLSKIFKNVYISTKESRKFNFPAKFILDNTQEIYAPTTGFVAAFRQLKAEKIFVISVDAPFVNKNEIDTIVLADKQNDDATVAKTNAGLQPLCGIYHRSLLSSFIKMQEEDNHKLGFLLKNSKSNYIHFNDEKAFLNLNHPHEYKEALEMLTIHS